MKYAKLMKSTAADAIATPYEGESKFPTATAAVKGNDKYTISLSSFIGLVICLLN